MDLTCFGLFHFCPQFASSVHAMLYTYVKASLEGFCHHDNITFICNCQNDLNALNYTCFYAHLDDLNIENYICMPNLKIPFMLTFVVLASNMWSDKPHTAAMM